MKLILRLFVVSAAGLLILVGCQKKEEKVNEETQVEALVGELGEDEIEGKVISARNISDYAYVELDTGKEKIWIARSRSDVKAGDIIRVTPSQVMKDFESKALDRTFESIIFVATIKVVKRAKAASDDGSGSSTVDETLISDSPAKGSIDKAEGGYTVAEIFEKRDSLESGVVKPYVLFVNILMNDQSPEKGTTKTFDVSPA